MKLVRKTIADFEKKYYFYQLLMKLEKHLRKWIESQLYRPTAPR
jgi:hypothetical protein